MRGRIGRFVLVGSAAAALHWGVVVSLVGLGGWAPLLANVVGWLSAFMLSFAGHHRWTFRAHGVPLRRAAQRFWLVSAAGFALNESAYALLLRCSEGRGFAPLLALVLIAVAGLTYWASRRWAFVPRSPAP